MGKLRAAEEHMWQFVVGRGIMEGVQILGEPISHVGEIFCSGIVGEIWTLYVWMRIIHFG